MFCALDVRPDQDIEYEGVEKSILAGGALLRPQSIHVGTPLKAKYIQYIDA